MTKQRFNSGELPYHTLAQFGLTREMIEDLPQRALEGILDGHRSPVLPISMSNDKGEEICARTRIMFTRLEDGTMDVVFFPQRVACDIERFSPEERKALLENRAILATTTTPDGKGLTAFYQIDPGTKQILYVPTPVIGRNLEVAANGLNLTNAELTCLRNGLPVTFMDNDEMITVGIDLNEQSGIRFAEGDSRKWNEERIRGFAKYNFGLNGCWVADEDGNLGYVPEDDYTEEMWAEMKKKNEQGIRL